MLLDLIEADRRQDATVLDVGGGIGIIDLELLRAGARRAVLVEASPAYLEAARAEAVEAGLADRLDIVAGDFVHHADAVDPADIVTLDRVVCCYPDAQALVTASAAKARLMLGLVLPRDRWYVRWVVRLINIRYRLTGHPYRSHAHANALIDTLAASAGLQARAQAFTAVWRVVVYARADVPR
jgi:magnesium-protoporphyrin O-methyltransferase